jgi:hypothetical protein
MIMTCSKRNAYISLVVNLSGRGSFRNERGLEFDTKADLK